ncbi:MAG: DUF3857 and transglutaminase domain-containing protein [Aridibacter sp.]
MTFPRNKRIVLLFSLCLIFVFSQITIAGDDWRPVTSEELAMKKGRVDADADAEAIFWEVRVDDASTNLIMEHYVRLKIFNERGREKFSKVDISYVKGIKIKDIEARVIKPDNTIIELNKNDVFEREIIKTNDIKVKAKSFAVPNIEAGVIVEYRYKEVYNGGSASDMRMIFQRDIPMQNVVYYFKPYQSVKYLTFNLENNKFVKDKKGFYKAELSNVPALKEESHMPPEDEVRSWLLLYYTSDRYLNADSMNFWSRVGGAMAYVYEIKDTLKPGKKMKSAAEEIIAGATTDEDKIRKLYDFCKTKVKNIDFDRKLTDEEKDDIKLNGDDDNTYKKLQGRSFEVNKLFASLADAAGFDTRIAFTGDRSKLFFNPQRSHESFIHMAGVAIKLDNRWRYFDPGSPFIPFGKLAWFEENTSVFLLAYKDFITTETPLSGYDESMEKRTGRFKLLEDGTLEGTVEIQYTGHLSYNYKMNNYDLSENAREELLKEQIKERMSTAEVSGINIENVTDPEKPFTYKYKVRVPNYAQKTGKRLFIQPGFFEYGSTPEFTSSTRKYQIYFKYPWSEVDDIQIQLPEGYSLDNAESPGLLADGQKISMLDINLKIDTNNNTLFFDRKFYFGGGGSILFPVQSYPAIKNIFDIYHKADSHTISLKKE